jgi:acetyltransferase-like isoleucine patch superfamily enzyme
MILRIANYFRKRVAQLTNKIKGASIGEKVNILGVIIPRNHNCIEIGDHSTLDVGCVLLISGQRKDYKKIKIGKRVYINRGVYVDASIFIEIADDVMIGPNCYITDHDHHYKSKDMLIRESGLDEKETVIERNVWIGANVTILKGVRIGENSVIAAGSVVTKSIPSNSVAAGVPACVKKLIDK